MKNVEADQEKCLKIFRDTLGQSANPEWFLARKYRLTGSRIHKIHRAHKTSTLLNYFHESSFKHKNLDYGKEMEERALASFCAKTGYQVLQSGLIGSTSNPWFLSSKDGLVCKDNIVVPLEIKCPIQAQDKDEIIVDYLTNNNTDLKHSHEYFTQCQALWWEQLLSFLCVE